MRCRLTLLLGLTACGFQGPFAGISNDGGGIDARLLDDGNVVQVDAELGIDGASSIDAPILMIDAGIHDAPPPPPPDANPWPCGLQPSSPATSVTFGNSTTGMTASAIGLNNAQMLVVTPNQPLQLKFHYSIHDSACQSCIDQIEYGFVQGTTGKRIDCAFDQTMQMGQTFTGNPPTQAFNAPATAGQYDLRLAQAQNFGCNYQGATNWFGGNAPAASQTIAIICVH